MIIVNAKSTNSFINENSTIEVIYDRKQKTVAMVGPDGNFDRHTDVESVVFVNGEEPMKYEVEGSEVKRLKEKYKKALEANQRYRDQIRNMYKVINTFKDDMREAFTYMEHAAQDEDTPVEIRKRIMNTCGDVRHKVNGQYYSDMLYDLNKTIKA